MNITQSNFDALEMLDQEDLLKLVKTMMSGGVVLNFHGKRTAQEIDRKVRPRQTQVIKKLCLGTSEEQAQNMIIEGENLQAMVTLYKERGQVDLILTDPPYNTGQHFRYNDKWDTDPNDPDLGQIVKLEDGSRHTKWMKSMLPRLNMMKAMLKPTGVLAICIDDNELFHLGMMMDEVFGEDNRIGIINWQKTFSPKNDSKHLSTATEYVLIYARSLDSAKTDLLPREKKMNSFFKDRDDDPEGEWSGKDPTAKEYRKNTVFGVQSPFTGNLHYPDFEHTFQSVPPEATKHWTGIKKAEIKKCLEAWGSKYIEKDLGDGRGKALVLKGADIKLVDYKPEDDSVVQKASELAFERHKKGNWPRFYFRNKRGGEIATGRPRMKNYLKHVQRGKVPLTYWADEDYDSPLVIGVQSWNHPESGHSQAGINELDAIIGKGHGFQTVKPLRLFKKIIQLWCPPNGLVLDPYTGSGTTGHAVLELNNETEAKRRFILIEQGSPEKGDKYARSLTQERIRRAITGERLSSSGELKIVAKPLGGGFQFRMLTQKIDSKTVLSMRKDELIDVVITSHWDNNNRGSSLIRIEQEEYKYLVGRNEQNEGYFLIWNGGNKVGQLDLETYATVIQEGKKANLKQPYHVYARYEIYQSRNIIFYKIPDKILMHLGLNENNDRYHEEQDQ
ncbi:MAG: site-specific DNA-methyltransferase [Nitrospirales bacterium]